MWGQRGQLKGKLNCAGVHKGQRCVQDQSPRGMLPLYVCMTAAIGSRVHGLARAAPSDSTSPALSPWFRSASASWPPALAAASAACTAAWLPGGTATTTCTSTACPRLYRLGMAATLLEALAVSCSRRLPALAGAEPWVAITTRSLQAWGEAGQASKREQMQ